MGIPEERGHIIEYGVVAVFIHEAFKERASQGRRLRAPALVAVLAAALLGALDECIQAFLPSRALPFEGVGVRIRVGAVATCGSG